MVEEHLHQPEKRVRLRGEERRALMLRTAKQIFARSTYAGASTSELARESKVTEPMLYKHFGSKKGLFLEVLHECGTQFLDRLQECLSRRAEQDVLDALAHVVDDYRAVLRADPETQNLFFKAVIESSDPEIAGQVGEHNRKVYRMILQLVERAHQEGYLDPAISPEVVAWGYVSLILAMQYSRMLHLSDDVAQAQDDMSRIWLRGLQSHRR
jgi:AcrR family transcriptional regulator